MADVITGLMDTAGYAAGKADAGASLVDCLRLADPTLRLLQRFSWDDAGLDTLRKCVHVMA